MKQLRAWLEEKQARGVKDVRVATVLAKLAEEPVEAELPKLFGTAEAAKFLKVERPRIGKWLKMGVMPKPAIRLEATPVWTLPQIKAMRPVRRERSRRKASESA